MAISSSGGSEPTSTPGAVIAPEGVQQQQAPGTAVDTTQQPLEGNAPTERPEWAGRMSDEEWTGYQAWQAEQAKGDGGGDSLSGSTEAGTGEEDLPEGARSADDIKASLKEAGGFYADERYEAAAIEFEQTGEVSEATLAATAEAFGIPVDMAKAFMDGQKAMREGAAQASPEEVALTADLHGVTGGADNYQALSDWSKENLTPAERAAYNTALGLTEGVPANPIAAKAMLADFNGRFLASGDGGLPRDITEQGGAARVATGSVTGYASQAEMTADMGKDQYRTDPAFRDLVAAKVAASKF